MEKKKTNYDEPLKKIFKQLLNDKATLKKEFDDLQSYKDYLIIYTVDEFIASTLKVSDTAYKNELHRILKPYVKKFLNSEFKNLIKARFELLQNKKKLNENSLSPDKKRDLGKELRLVRAFLDDSIYKNMDGVKGLGARLPRNLEDNIVVNLFCDSEDGIHEELTNIADNLYNDIKKVLGIKTYVTLTWI